MKRVLYFAATLAELGMLAGTYALNYFTVNRLGMVRWVNFNSRKWESALPMPALRLLAVALLAALSVLALCLYLRRRKGLNRMAGVMAASACAVSSVCVGYMLLSSFESMRAYYLICALLLGAAVIQLVKAFVGLRVCRAEGVPADEA